MACTVLVTAADAPAARATLEYPECSRPSGEHGVDVSDDLRRFSVYLSIALLGCGSTNAGSSTAGASGGSSDRAESGGERPADGAGGTSPAAAGGASVGNGGTGAGGAPAGRAGAASGGATATGGTSSGGVSGAGGAGTEAGGARGLTDAGPDAAPPVPAALVAGVNVHGYPKPTAYGYVAADGKDRMGSALVALGSPGVRGGTIGDTAFLARLASFGVKDVVLLLSASAEGKPFDPAAVGPLLQKSIDAAEPLGLTLRVEGLNEWDLFNTKSYNAGVLPSGMTASDFVLYTQKALYEAAHAKGLAVLGPSVGHSTDASNLAFFPDVSAYVDIVNAHLYFGSNPESLPVAAVAQSHARFQGSGKPLWVTETGISSYGNVSAASQADVIRRGLGVFAASKLIARAYVYELLDEQLPGTSGTTYTPDSAEYHFGLFTYAGDAKPAATAFQSFTKAP